jgi:hypothetical protein
MIRINYLNRISILLRSVRQPLLQVVLYVLIYEIIIRSLISIGFLKMNLVLGITAEYLFYLYVILSTVLLVVSAFKRPIILYILV